LALIRIPFIRGEFSPVETSKPGSFEPGFFIGVRPIPTRFSLTFAHLSAYGDKLGTLFMVILQHGKAKDLRE
jgi:hypothetical protein